MFELALANVLDQRHRCAQALAAARSRRPGRLWCVFEHTGRYRRGKPVLRLRWL